MIACIALAVALGGTATAARTLIHSKDIAPGAVKARNIAKGAVTKAKLARGVGVAGPQGPQGPAGPKGDTGPVGPSNAFQATQATSSLTIAATATDYVPVSLSLPAAGIFQVSCHLEIQDFDPANSAGSRFTVTATFPGASLPADTQTMAPRFLNGVVYQDSRTWSGTYLVSVPGARTLSLTVRSDLLSGTTSVSNGVCTAIGVASGTGATAIP
jgi:hypothetical protein